MFIVINMKLYMKPTLLQKLPDDIRLRILSDRYTDKSFYTLGFFIALLTKEIDSRDKCQEHNGQSTNITSDIGILNHTVF